VLTVSAGALADHFARPSMCKQSRPQELPSFAAEAEAAEESRLVSTDRMV